MSNKRDIIWAPRAIKQLNAAIEYIRNESYQSAESVKEKILSEISRLSDTVVRHRADQYKNNNDGHFRYIEISSYRISYHEGEDEITIVRIRHVNRKPLYY